jgi:DNA-binding response OmpR family regulator
VSEQRGQVVLVTEDESEILELLAMLFESEGYPVLKAADGQIALEIVKAYRDRIILLVTDLGLPKLGGIELIRESKALVPTLKVIAASGFGHERVRVELRKVGVDDFFPKPFSPIELLDAAKRLRQEK